MSFAVLSALVGSVTLALKVHATEMFSFIREVIHVCFERNKKLGGSVSLV